MATLTGINSFVRWIISFIGLLLVILFMYKVGKEFLGFNLYGFKNKIPAIFITILMPWLLGTDLVIFAYLPLRNYYVIGIISSSIFWIFSLIAAIKNKTEQRPAIILTSLNFIDVALTLVSIFIVRFLIRGVDFVP